MRTRSYGGHSRPSHLRLQLLELLLTLSEQRQLICAYFLDLGCSVELLRSMTRPAGLNLGMDMDMSSDRRIHKTRITAENLPISLTSSFFRHGGKLSRACRSRST